MDFSYLKELVNNNNLIIEDTLISSEKIDYIISKFFRPYQKDMWNMFKETFKYAKNGENAWHFKAGTGSGKTEVFKFIPPYMMAKSKEEGNNEGLVFGLVCHRLCLIEDLRNRILPTLFGNPDFNNVMNYVGKNSAGCGLNKEKVKFYIVNSGSYKTTNSINNDIKNDKDEIINSRSTAINNCLNNAKHVKEFIDNNNFKSLQKEIEENRKRGIHSMFICLYQSLATYNNKLSKLNFDFIIGDECHALNNMGAEVFTNCCKFFNTVKKSYFFSATPQYHIDDPNKGTSQICLKKSNDEFNEIEE